MRSDKEYLIFMFIIIALSCLFAYVIAFEYRMGVGPFFDPVKTEVITFDTIHGDSNYRILVSTGKCIFTVGEEYSWIQENTPYKVTWLIVTIKGSSNTRTDLISIEKVS